VKVKERKTLTLRVVFLRETLDLVIALDDFPFFCRSF